MLGKALMNENLILRGTTKFFDALQEKASRDSYGMILGRLVCFYIRLIKLQEDMEEDSIVDWYERYPLNEFQIEKLRNLIALVESGVEDMEVLNDAFHEAVKGLFCWTESRKLLEEIACPVQRFLMSVCLRKEGKGFIHVRDITPLIAKLMYCIRATIFTELMKREGSELNLDKDLDGLQVFVKDLIQSPFGFLSETMHLAAKIAGDASALPQVIWLGNNEYKSLAIHGKRVDLEQLQDMCQKLLRDATRKFRHEIKMGLPGFKDMNWVSFDPIDDLAKLSENYSFINTSFKGKKKVLLDQFLANRVTESYFVRGRVNGRILWNKDNCMSWMRKCKEFLGILAILCHLLGGQPARATEMVTTTWKNTAEEQRGVLWANKTMMMLGRYSKTRSMTSTDRLIARYNLNRCN